MIDALMIDLSRWQFAVTSLYHFIFVPLTLGISWIVFIMELMYVKTSSPVYKDMCRFFGKLFAINFAIGVATGITMEFEFGTNWSHYSHYVGDIFGAPLALEGLMAFFLESTFIGLMFSTWDRFSKGTHLAVTFLTALGSNLSAMWILIANSFMQYPEFSEFSPVSMRMEMTDFFGLVFSPVAQVKFLHTISGAYITASVFVIGVSAYIMLKGRHYDFAKRSMIIAASFGICSLVLSALSGDLSAIEVTKHQPEKLAAMEAEYETQKAPAAWSLVAVPNENEMKNDYAIKIPGLLGLIATHSLDTEVKGLKDLIEENRERIEDGVIAYSALKILRNEDATKEDRAEALKIFNEFKQDLGYGLLLVEHAKYPLHPTESELDKAARASVPSVPICFVSFRAMLFLMGLCAMVFAAVVFFLVIRKDLEKRSFVLKLLLWSIPLPFIACEFGWILAEMGRQPWAVQGMLPTYLAASDLKASDLMITLPLFITVYSVFLFIEMRMMFRAVKNGPEITTGV
ncbi:MAG: cytochrome ubiquinol oxidase subunit I [Succinivibrio sp.]